jgi:pimeloyl-ACP methyl ester carboxylesterase
LSGTAPTRDGRAELHWESEGSGISILLIAGLALGASSWWRTVPVLATRFRVLTYDHRGVGRSASKTQTHSTTEMAEDAVAVLDAAGVDAAHVYGFSLGGMVAQQLALRAPGRVRSLVIGATHPGGHRATFPAPDVLSFFRRRPNLPHEEAAWASVPFNYGARCRREHVDRIGQDIERRLSMPFAAAAYRAQLTAGSIHDCGARLREISAPTLVVHGREDRMIPVPNAEALADGIPGARLRILDEAGHLYTTDEPEIDAEIGAFLAEAS